MGIEMMTGVRKETPINPYLLHNFTNRLDLGENTFLLAACSSTRLYVISMSPSVLLGLLNI